MIKDTDILNAVIGILKSKFGYKNFKHEDRKKVQEPSFFVSVTHLNTTPYKEFNQKSINLYITYTNLTPQQEELLNVGNSLDELFSMYLKVNSMSLQIKQKKISPPRDGFITMTLTIDFKDSKETIETAKLMENLNLKTN